MSQTNKISLAIIGGGINSAVGIAHYSAINLSDKFRIICGSFSRDSDINRSSGEKYNIPEENLYSDWKKMLTERKDQIGGIVILTPTDQHFDQVYFALDLSIPVICEKSLVGNYGEILKIEEKLNDNFICVVFNYISYPMIKELKSMIDRGILGKINQIQIEMPQEGFIRKSKKSRPKPQAWRLKENEISNLSLDLGTHLFSMVKFLLGVSPIEVVSINNTFGNFSGVVDDINCIIKYSENLVCNMWMSKSALGNKNGLKIRVYGSEGSAEWFQMDPELLRISDSFGKIMIMDRGSDESLVSSEERYNRFKPGHPGGFVEALSNFYEDVYIDLVNSSEGKERLTFGVKESKECIELLRAISKSALNNSWVKIDKEK